MPYASMKKYRSNTLVFAFALVYSMKAWTAPTGGEIVSGSGSIQTDSAANNTIITQESSTLGIDWQSFDVQAHETVTFQQPSSDASALNRILDEKPSEIFGRINANGRVYLLNPNGILFGESSRVNVGALVTGNMDLSQEAFSDQRFEFFSSSDTTESSVTNRGILTAMPGGSINLIGHNLKNEGSISAEGGQINLVAGRRIIMNLDGSDILGFTVSEGLLENSLQDSAAIENSGKLLAEGGQIVLDGKMTGDVLNTVINNTGIIRATRIDNSGGVIRLVGEGGMLTHSGQIEAQGDDASRHGGSVSISADRIGLYGDASVDVSAAYGGGSISIGNKPVAGESNGLPTSEFTQLDKGTRLSADAEVNGQGGEIIVWADDSLWAYGSVSATGGAAGGDGGFVELSGRRGLSFAGQVDLTAALGKWGTLLFDPDDVIIHDQGDGAQANDGDLPDLSSPPSTGTFDIGEAALEAIASTTNIIIEATNDITINSLTTDGELAFATINGSSVTFAADSDGDGTGSFTMDTADTLSTQGGGINITGANITAGIISTDISGSNDGAIALSATGSASVVSANAGSTTINIAVDSDGNGVETLTIGGALAGTGITLKGGSNGNDTLIGPNSANVWTITSLSAGTLNGASFSSFTNLTGGSGDDSFTFNGIGSLPGLINGGSHSTGDMVDYTGKTSLVSVTLGTNVTNVETLIGRGTDSTLIGSNTASTWTITSQNDGSVGTVNFVDFNNLTGGSSNDNFVLSGGSVTGIVTGGTGTDSLTANNATNNWNILTPNGGTVDGIFSFSGIENLIGGSSADSFALNGGSISGSIDGGGGNDSLAGDNVVNIWNITGPDSGDLTGVGSFTSIENLVGRTAVDSFVFDASGSISGSINGGSGVDEVDLSALSGSITVDLTSGEYSNIESYTGNGSNSTFIADSIINTWTLNSANSGTMNTIDFVGFASLVGGSSDDTFIFSGGAPDTSITGGGGTDTIVADITNNTWLITGTDSGQINGRTFSNIDNLTGNTGSDTFYFSNGGTISGFVNGAGGSDTVDYSGEAGAVSVDIGNTGFSNIETYIGNNTDSTLIGENTANSWLITGQNDGTINTLVFSNFNYLTGNLNADTFTLSGGSVTGAINGGGGTDTISAANAVNNWNITGADSGSVTGIASFSAIDNLSGNLNSDTFTFSTGASISGSINGGAGNDIVDFSGVSGSVSVSLGASNYSNIETFIGNGSNSTLVGDDVANTWLIDGANDGVINLTNFIDFANLTGGTDTDYYYLNGGSIAGTIDGGGGSDGLFADDVANSWNITGTDSGSVTGVTAFTNMERLIGGTTTDTFTFSALGDISGEVNGSSGSDVVDQSAITSSISIVLGGSKYSNIETYIGNAVDSTLQGQNASNTWTITGANSGTVGAISFVDFNNLTGGTGTDYFSISGGSISGQIDGGDGSDTLQAGVANNSWNISGTDAGSVTAVSTFSHIERLVGNTLADNFIFNNASSISGNVNGGGGTDTVDFSAEAGAVLVTLGASGFQNIEAFVGNNIDSTILGDNTPNTWTITGTNDGTVGGISFTNFTNLTGNLTTDTFIYTASGDITGVIDGGDGLDTLNMSARPGIITLQLDGSDITNIETLIGNGTSSTLVGGLSANNWQITGADSGVVNSIAFSGFNNLSGNTAVDTFTLSGGSISGTINGGASNDRIIAQDLANTWTINGSNAGSVTGINAFTSIEELQGGSGTDNFVFSNGGDITGAVLGMAGTDTLDQSAQTATVIVDIASGIYADIENFVGNGSSSTLAGDNTANTWIISGANSGLLGTLNFSGFNNLRGGDNADVFTLSGGSVTGSIDGGAGTDTLYADTGVNTWNISGTNTGNVTGVGSFSNLESLIGNSSADYFVFSNGGTFSGSIDGSLGSDEVDFSSELGAVTVVLGSSQYSSIELYTGNNTNSTLIAENQVNDWQITGINSGTVSGETFAGFNNLTGNSNADDFTLNGGAITGQIAGGGGNDTLFAENGSNTWNIILTDSGSVDGINAFSDIDNLVGGSSVDTFNIDANISGSITGSGGDDVFNMGIGAIVSGGITGASGSDTLYGADSTNSWTITSSNSGTLNTTNFSSMETLHGGSGADNFTLSDLSGVAVTGGIFGGAGNDSFTVDYAGADSRTLVLAGESGTDTLILQGGGSGFSTTYQAGVTLGSAVLTTSGLGQTQTLNVSGIDSIEDTQIADSASVTATSSDDAIQLSLGTASGSQPIQISAATMIAYDTANKAAIDINTGLGTDSIDILSDLTFTDSLRLSAESISNSSSSVLTGDALIIDGATDIGSSLLPIATDINTLTISGNTATAYIQEQNGLAIGVDSVSSMLDVATLSGDITSVGAIVVSGDSHFTTANGGSILLTDSGNDFTGSIQFTASSGLIGDISIVDSSAVDLDAFTMGGDLTIQAQGEITQNGAINIGGDSSFSAGANRIILNNPANTFSGSVALSNSGQNNVAISVSGNLDFATTGIGTGTFTVSADAISQTGPITQEASAGTVTITSSSGPVDLSNGANDFTGLVVITNNGANGISISDADNLQLGSTSTQGGGITVSAANGVDLSGTMTSTDSDISITATSGDIQLGRLDAGSGDIIINAVNGALIGNNSPITDPNLSAQNLELYTGTTLGEFSNPIAVDVPSNGTSLFVVGDGIAHILGYPGKILAGSSLVNNVALTGQAVSQSQELSLEIPLYLLIDRSHWDNELYSVADGGIRLPYREEDLEKKKRQPASGQ